MSDLAIEIRGLTKSYKDVNALKGVDVLIKKGEFSNSPMLSLC